jgi:hypothetical protein
MFLLSVTNKPFMLSVVLLNVIMPSVVMLNVLSPSAAEKKVSTKNVENFAIKGHLLFFIKSPY